MKRYQYTVSLRSEIIITAVTATEGFNPSLDYIPGAKFLGICAKALYNQDNPSTLDLFHNGKVRFGDALPFVNGETALPVPFSWHTPKGNNLMEKPIYISNLMDSKHYKELNEKGIQLKQAREGYFTPRSREFVKFKQHFIIRSAYDIQQLRSMDSQMFGYYSLPKGSEWTFIVEDETGNYAETIKQSLIGLKRIGRSKSAEYGLVDIAFHQELSAPPSPQHEIDTSVFLYAKSNLCFYNYFGRPTLQPEPEQLGFPGASIDWNKSQIRHRLYQTWNTKRHNRDADRLIIEKGSVIALNSVQADHIDWSLLTKGIGSHLAEGFGKVLVNPSFVAANHYQLDDALKRATFIINKPDVLPDDTDELMIKHLAQSYKIKQDVNTMDNQINDFIRTNKNSFAGISESQWGMVRAYAKQARDWSELDTLLFHEGGALRRGKTEIVWRTKGRLYKLKEFITSVKSLDDNGRVQLTIKVASEMAKSKNK